MIRWTKIRWSEQLPSSASATAAKQPSCFKDFTRFNTWTALLHRLKIWNPTSSRCLPSIHGRKWNGDFNIMNLDEFGWIIHSILNVETSPESETSRVHVQACVIRWFDAKATSHHCTIWTTCCNVLDPVTNPAPKALVESWWFQTM